MSMTLYLQYPQTGRTSCNLEKMLNERRTTLLQYPQTGRTSCNWRLPDSDRWQCIPLQYPQTGRTSCNASALNQPASPIHLQYPQTGRTSCNALYSALNNSLPPLAVPSDGSNLMQPGLKDKNGKEVYDLQYPQTGRTSCNFTQVGDKCSNLTCSTLRRVEPHATANEAYSV